MTEPFSRRGGLPARAFLVFSFFLSVLGSSASIAFGGGDKAANHVDPFIGTANSGNTFPGALRPWGMVSVSPHTDLSAPSGYVHGRPWFYGLGHVHLSGTGCPDLGSIILTAVRGEVTTDPQEYKCRLADEKAEPGYWAGTLVGPALRAEATATIRSGITRFTAQADTGFAILIDAGRSLSLLGGGSVRWISDRDLEGYSIGGGFCGKTNRHVIYFVAQLSREPSSKGVWKNSVVSRDTAALLPDSSIGAWARYELKRDSSLEVRIGISYVSIDNARRNLRAETSGRTFAQAREACFTVWNNELSRIRVWGGTPDDQAKFYTALYHSLIHPGVITDANGDYPLFGKKGTGNYAQGERYSVFSLWDTYRTLHPLLALVYPERQSAMVRTMIDMYKESGSLPNWELAGNETRVMVGDGAVPVIADTYLKGIRDFDTVAAYEAMRKSGAVTGPESESSRPGYEEYVRYGYIPCDRDTSRKAWVWGPVSTTLEYCFADWTFSRVAAATGRKKDAEVFAKRALWYKNLFDKTTGFIRPRRAGGAWLSPFDPLQTEGSGNWAGSGGPGYVEGNAWQYSWFVPHDIEGLAKLYGGKERLAEKLEECFAGGRFTMNNEPDIAYPYLFTYLHGHEARTSDLVRQIMAKDFGTGPAGLPGNDDAGTLSAWYVFSALGLYPACPGSNEYRLGAPLFDQSAILLNRKYYPATMITIKRQDSAGSTAAQQETRWNGKPVKGFAVDHAALVAGGELVFAVRRVSPP
jgi:predicted alpha-1,2-mannosidase